jgi:mycofactocin system FadH/OYE family oxidoreductase 2
MPSLTDSVPLGSLTAPSRIVFAAHRTNFATHRKFEARHVGYYEARARGGAGVIVLETVTVHPSDWPYEYAPLGYEPSVVQGYRAVVQAVKKHGAIALASLGHTGGQGSSHYSQAPLWAPTPIPEVNSREVPMEMEPGDIATLVKGFARAAVFALEGGLDGVEINVGQSSVLRQFLSPLTNRRGDDFGGGLENRARFALQVIAAVRKAIGPSALLGVRVVGDEYAPWAGLVPETAAEAAALLAGGGGATNADFVSVTSGSIYSLHMTRAGLYAAPGHSAGLAATVKAKLQDRVPVFAQGSVVDADMAESLLREGKADLVEMTRALIAEPELVAKWRSGTAESKKSIRPCVLCNQDCVVETVQNARLGCIQNPAAGYELEEEFRPLAQAKARAKKRVLVLGAGPAGMEAARVATLRGHQVTVVGAAKGGTVRIAAAAPGRARLGLVCDWLEGQLADLGVTVKEATVTAESLPALVKEHQADVVLHCTGATPKRRRFVDFTADAKTVTPRDVLDGKIEKPALPDGRVPRALVLDEAGDHAGMGTAEWLVGDGWEVTVISHDMFVGQRLTATMELTPYNQRAAGKNIRLRPQIEVQRIGNGRVDGVDIYSRAPLTFEAELIVDVSYEVPREGLTADEDALSAGDAVAPRRIGQAILEGHRLGRSL